MNVHFEGALSPADAKRHLPFEFEVPAGTQQVLIEMWHAEGHTDGLSNMLTLTLFDPNGHRGAGHRMGTPMKGKRLHRIAISPEQATPGYEAGPLPAGQWRLFIDTHRVTDAAPCTYRIDIACSEQPDTSPRKPSPPIPQPFAPTQGPNWYRGDLHGHTKHSDGSWDVIDLLVYARRYNLNFVTLSDHNTVSPLAELDGYNSPDLLTIGGMELTTFWGHALALGTRQWVDWRVDGSKRTMPMIAQEAMAQGATYIIAHPMAIGDPICTGCSWMYEDMRPGPARIVEIWNGGDWDNESFNEKGLALYYQWLNQGHRLAATSGTDIHGPLPADMRPGFNVVYAEALTEPAILTAIRAGHLFVSNGPHVEFTAQSIQGHTGMMGDQLPLIPATLTAMWRDAMVGMQLRIIVDGSCIHQQTINELGSHQWQLAGQSRWCTVEIREAGGNIAAVTNPIFFG